MRFNIVIDIVYKQNVWFFDWNLLNSIDMIRKSPNAPHNFLSTYLLYTKQLFRCINYTEIYCENIYVYMFIQVNRVYYSNAYLKQSFYTVI
jgi:hypothetical protein